MRIEHAITLTETDSMSIRSIWNAVYPAFMAHATIESMETYLSSLKKPRHTILRDEKSLKGWLCTFDRNDERWFVMILHPTAQKRGFGTRLLSEALAAESSLSGWVVDHGRYALSDGSPYVSPLPFYLKLGFRLGAERFDDGQLEAVRVRWENQ